MPTPNTNNPGYRMNRGRRITGLNHGSSPPCRSKENLEAVAKENQWLREALAETRNSEARYARWFHFAPAAFVVLDNSGSLLHLNPLAEVRLGLKPGAAIGEPFTRFLDRADIVPFLSHLRDCQCKHQPAEIEVRLRGSFGKETVLRLRTSCVPQSDRSAVSYVMLTDEAERQTADAKRAQADREYRELLDSIAAIVWEADAETLQRTRVNKHAERLLGYPVSQWLEDPCFWRQRIFVEDRETTLNSIARAVALRRGYTCEYRMIAADRRVVWIRDCAQMIQDGGRPKLRGVAVDISEYKRVQAELKDEQAQLEAHFSERTAEWQRVMAELESFSYTLSHDMRGPVRAMHSFSELVAMRWGEQLGPEGTDFLRRIQDGAARLDSLIQDVLKYAGVAKASIELQTVEVDRLLRDLIAEYPWLQPPQAEIEIAGPLIPVRAHEGFLTQCFSNLLSNAVKFVPSNRKPRVRIHSRNTGNLVQIWIEDNGIGIPAREHLRIFQLFQCVNPPGAYPGAGVGLAVVRRAVERMGGQVGVESLPGRGSKFWLQFHRAD